VNKLTLREQDGGQTFISTFLLVDKNAWESEPNEGVELDIKGGPIVITPDGLVDKGSGWEVAGVNVARSKTQNFAMTFNIPEDEGDYDVFWIVRPFVWEDHPGQGLSVNTKIAANPGNMSAILTVASNEIFRTLQVEVYVSTFYRTYSKAVKINVVAP
jgi:hypothetical protein